jgi:hypothetical protein
MTIPLKDEDLTRARTFITMPSLCSVYSCCEWIEALLDHIDFLNKEIRRNQHIDSNTS